MGKPKPSPDLYKKSKGYGMLNQVWKPVAGFPEYEVTALRQVRRTTTHAPSRPYKYMLRPDEGEFVDFWINGQKIIVSLESIMSAAFPKGES